MKKKGRAMFSTKGMLAVFLSVMFLLSWVEHISISADVGGTLNDVTGHVKVNFLFL